MARTARLLGLLVPACALAFLGLAGAAQADSTLTQSGSTVTFTAGAGELNSLTIRVNAPNIEFQGIQDINESIGFCAGSGTTLVRCGDTSVSAIVIDLGDDNDALTIESIDDPLTSVDLGPGNDTFTIEATSAPISVDAGVGADTIVLGTVAPPIRVDGILAPLTLAGGSGLDSLVVNDTQSSSDNIVTVSSSSIGAALGDSFFGTNGQATYSQIETVSVTAGVGDSLIKVLSSSSAASTTLDAGPGDDLFQLSSNGTGSTGDLDGLLGPLSLLGGTGDNILIASDADATSGNTATISGASIAGLAPVSILYSTTGTFAGGFVIRGSGHDDTFSVTGTVAGGTTDIRTLAGNDTVLVSSNGSGTSGDLSTILGGLALDLGAGANTLAISDAGDAVPGANANVSMSPTSITGLAGPGDASGITIATSGGTMAGLTVVGSTSASTPEGYTIGDVPGPLTLFAGAGNDTVTLQGAAHTVVLLAGDGNDAVSLGSPGGTLDGIAAPVSIDGGNGYDSVLLDDSADPSADIVGVTPATVGSEPGNSLLGPGATFSHSAIEQLTLNLGTGSDSVTIGATASGTATSVNAGAGDDFLFVPGASANLDSILSPLALDGGPGFNSLVLDDSNDSTGDTVTMTASTVGQDPGDTLFGPGGSLTYGSFTLLALSLGTGDDHVLIEGSPAGSIATGAGKDTVELADLAALTGTVDAGPGSDTLSYQGVAAPITVALGVGAAHGTSGVEGFENVVGGSGADTLTGLDEARSRLAGGPGKDTLRGGTGNDHLDGGAGNDRLDGGKGNDTYAIGAGNDRIVDVAGKDAVDFSNARKGVKIDLSKTGKKRQRLGKGVGSVRLQAAIENAVGSDFGDRIIGNGLRNVLKGGGGKDALTGAAGNDTLIGGAGIDRVVEAADKNFKLTPKRLTGRGIDRLRSIERATLEGGQSNNILFASAFKGRVILRGGGGNDRLTGGRRADLLVGGDGDDILTGGNGKDQLIAGSGNDQVFVKDGTADVVNAGIGWDRASSDVGDRLISVEYLLG